MNYFSQFMTEYGTSIANYVIALTACIIAQTLITMFNNDDGKPKTSVWKAIFYGFISTVLSAGLYRWYYNATTKDMDIELKIIVAVVISLLSGTIVKMISDKSFAEAVLAAGVASIGSFKSFGSNFAAAYKESKASAEKKEKENKESEEDKHRSEEESSNKSKEESK